LADAWAPRRAAGRDWLLLLALLAKLSLLAWLLPAAALDWQPGLIAHQPWRLLSAAFVHWTPTHLAANLAGCAVLAVLGWRAGLGRREALAGLIALPLTQLGLALRPELAHYGGLSGELHALVVIVGLSLLPRRGRERAVGAAVLAGLVIKLVLEQPLGPVLRATPGFDFPVAPLAHLSGALAGLLAAGLTMRGHRFPGSPHGT